MTRKEMKTRTVTGYSAWAAQLVNNDAEGQTEDDAATLAIWLDYHGLRAADCVAVASEPYFAAPEGMPSFARGEVVDFSFRS